MIIAMFTAHNREEDDEIGGGDSSQDVATETATHGNSVSTPNANRNSSSTPEGQLKRPYRFVRRRANPRQNTEMRKRWKQDMDELASGLQTTQCCKKLKCFYNANVDFLKSKMTTSRDLSFENRRLALTQMMGSNGKFYFDGKVVCNIFLKKAFCFSGDLISSIRHGTKRVRQDDSMGSEFH